MRLRPLSVVAAFVLLLVLAWTAYWSAAANRLKGWIDAWAAAERAGGSVVDYADLRVSGFPLELRLDAGAVRIRRPDGVILSTTRLSMMAEPWAPLDVAFMLDGEPHLVLPPAGARPSLALHAAAGAGRAEFSTAGTLDGLTMTLTRPRLDLGGTDRALSAATVDVALDKPAAPPDTHADPGLLVGMALRDLTLPGDPLMGAAVQRADLSLTVKGDPPDSLDVAAVRAWSEDGGTVDLAIAAVDWGDLRLSGDATLALDGALQPIGAGTVTLVGFETLFDRLAATGRMDRQRATLAKTVLGLLARPTPDGALALKAPVTLQDRRLTLGAVPVTELPVVDWK